MKRYIQVTAVVAAMSLVGAARLAAQEGDVDVDRAPVAEADTVNMSLERAISLALGQSEEIQLARSQVELASAQIGVARSQLFPQVNANLGYTKTFASAFDTGGGGFELPDSLRFDPDPTAPLPERVSYLEDNVGLAALSGIGGLFGDLPFGQENAYTATVSGEQMIWSGGRALAGLRIANDTRTAASYTLQEEAAEIELQVETAYYQALLAQELETISEAAVEQAQAFLDQEQLRLRAGQASELDVLRAEVSLENLRPQLVQARNAADLARLNLKRLTDVPASQPLRLTTTLTENLPQALAEPGLDPTLLSSQRASILAAEHQVEIREEQVKLVRGSYLPNIVLRMSYGKQAFPGDLFDFGTDWRTDWSATLNVSFPVFTGFRRGAEMAQARVQLDQSRLQVAQLREAVQLEYEQARGEKERARSEIAARQRTVDQAQRVHDLTVLQYDEGLATQLEVTDARLSLLQARTNLAQAITDFYIADAQVTRALGQERVDIVTDVTPTSPAGGVGVQ